ncbi:MAG: alpha/beta hydrolase [Siculibacillus sp.]|nr:alpha/beta hydrolase [Siculibacillus sp.]
MDVCPPLDPPHGVAFGPEMRDALGTVHRPFRFFSADGLVLAGRDHPPLGDTDRRPVVCLPGLTRNSRDFEPLAARLVAGSATTPPRRVVTFDFRGRGASSRDGDPARYNVAQELSDTRLGLAALGIERITAFGTSRGGIVTMIAGAMAPGLVEAAVLNDIGAEVELAGLLRIKGYVGRPIPEGFSWDDLVVAMKIANRGEFPALDDAGWHRFARRLHRDVDGRPALDYDPHLAETLAAISPQTPMPDLWPAFDTLAGVPVLLLRGARSDLLSPATTAKMAERHPALEVVEVADEGHAPLLEDTPTLDAIVDFLDRVGA